MGNENPKPKTLSFSDAKIQALMEAKMSADTSLTQAEAIRRVFHDAGLSDVAEQAMKDQIGEHQENLRKAEERIHVLEQQIEGFQSVNETLTKENNDMTAELARMKEQKPFCDLSVLDVDAADALTEARNEMLGKQIHPTTADWLAFMLYKMQEVGHYVPDSGKRIPKTSLKFKAWQKK